jgi:hypothetical protein
MLLLGQIELLAQMELLAQIELLAQTELLAQMELFAQIELVPAMLLVLLTADAPHAARVPLTPRLAQTEAGSKFKDIVPAIGLKLAMGDNAFPLGV